ncbi:MAG: hypothetical protein H0U74_17735 [Bradymonadaceae bacterium]|nr:hypothetical protein [Lujinxingiaceae bacterium]
MSAEDIDKLLRSYRKTPLRAHDALPRNLAHTGQDLVERLLPHRAPMLLVDRLLGVDLSESLAYGQRLIGSDHLGIAGHFPGYPVLPGAIQIEMLGQLGLCMFRFLEAGALELADALPPLNIRATKILGAHFLAEVVPGDMVELVAQCLEMDDFLATSITQARVGERIVCVMAGEVAFV